jgi:hypothetical protein
MPDSPPASEVLSREDGPTPLSLHRGRHHGSCSGTLYLEETEDWSEGTSGDPVRPTNATEFDRTKVREVDVWERGRLAAVTSTSWLYDGVK